MEKVRLAVDVASGDFGPGVVIKGVIAALRKAQSPVEAVLCGDQRKIEQVLEEQGIGSGTFRDSIAIEHCSGDVVVPVTMRSRAWKDRVDSPAVRCIALQHEGRVEASISAGDTGVLMGASLFILGRRDNAKRPVLAALMPTVLKKPVLLLDVGANINCRHEHLVSFARLGQEYMGAMAGVEKPIVRLLNVGSEQVKGTPAIGEADAVLRETMTGYAGFIEGDGVLSGTADVVVCDGFAGNVLLKACESFYRLVGSVLESNSGLFSKLMTTMEPLNSENYGAVPFLGIRGIVLKAHGGSSPKAIESAVMVAERAVRRNAEKRLFS